MDSSVVEQIDEVQPEDIHSHAAFDHQPAPWRRGSADPGTAVVDLARQVAGERPVLEDDLLTCSGDAAGLRTASQVDVPRLHAVLLALWGQPAPVMP